jgi:hypothetical protein
MSFEIIFLAAVVVIAFLIIVATVIGVFIVLRRPSPQPSQPRPGADMVIGEETITPGSDPSQQPTYVPTPQEDIEAYLSEQRANLADFELTDLSTSFKGTTNEGQRQGVILHLTQADTPLVAFTSQTFSSQNGSINAETVYGKMELIVAQGKAGVQWEGSPLGILDYSKQRILGPEGQLLGNMERPTGSSEEVGSYPIGFFGQKVADVTTKVNAIATLRWFGGEETEQLPAFKDLEAGLEDNQTLLLLGALLLEIAFFDLL